MQRTEALRILLLENLERHWLAASAANLFSILAAVGRRESLKYIQAAVLFLCIETQGGKRLFLRILPY
jgi:hypothetical protein